MLCCVALVWISSACISLPPLLVLGNDHGKPAEIDAVTGQMLDPGRPECNVCQEFGYQIYATLGSFYIPLGVMAAVYYQIFQAAKRIVDEEMKAQSHLLLTRASSQRLKQQQQQQQQQQRLLPPSIAVDSSATNGHGEGRNQLVTFIFSQNGNIENDQM
jgi:5-hydroxytryptamine receptor 7